MLYVFQLKPFKEWSFDKLQILLAEILHKNFSFFSGSNSKLSFP